VIAGSSTALVVLESFSLTGEPVRLSLAPGRGGKITRLDTPGRTWLSPADVLLDAPSGLPFVEAEMAGWDECAPSIIAGTLADGTTLSDHGDLWDRPWRLERDASGLVASVDGADWPYAFTRTIRAVDGGFALDYEVTNTSAASRPFLWAAHPQFLAEPASWVEIPQAAEVIDVADPRRPLPNRRDLQLVPDGSSRKLWTLADDDVREATLHHPDGSWLRLSWTGPDVRWCGIWIDGADYATARVVAVEPSTGWYDDVVEAAAHGRVLVLEPGQQVGWTLRLSLHTAG
jgi:galactose mutarotase-like enzyme